MADFTRIVFVKPFCAHVILVANRVLRARSRVKRVSRAEKWTRKEYRKGL